MRKILGNRTRTLSFFLAVAMVSLAFAGIIYKEDGSIDAEATFNWSMYNTYIENGFQTENDLLDDFNLSQSEWLALVPPGTDLLSQAAGMRYFDPAGFPKELVEGLVAEQSKGGAEVYPVTIWEDPKTQERVFINSKGDKIYTADPPEGYDSRWFLLERHPNIENYSENEVAELEAAYSPSKVAIRYDLIEKDDLIKYVMYLSLLSAPDSMMMKSSWEGGTVTNFKFVAMDRSSNGMVELTIAWPTNSLSTNMVDFFSCPDLLAADWGIALTTNIDLNTNCFSWLDTASSNLTTRFYDCWTFADTDTDGLSDGREKRLYGTDKDDWDTDGDSVGDGAEVLTYGTDPINVHNSLLPYSTSFESTNSYATGTLDGQNGWEGSTGATIQAGVARSGEQAVELEAIEADMTKHFATTNSSVTTELFAYLGPQFSVPTNLPASASSLVSYESGTGLRGFDGNGSGGGSWSTASGTTNLLNQWVELRVVQNYSAKTWSLYVNDTLKLSGLGFKDDDVTQLEAMHLRSGIGGAVICDDVAISN